MLIVWTWLLALGLMAGHGEAQNCTQIFGGPNLARGRPTSQSSTYPVASGIVGLSSNAVDGNCDGQWSSGSCSHTCGDLNAWWSVDLGREYAISLVVVKNREDFCGKRMRGATIHVGDQMGDFSARSFVCGTIADIRDGSLSTIFCNGAVGRFITIVIPNRVEYLHLGEVEVYGTNIPPQA
uniref:fucolectin-like n=1 Tax=Euleptes europaea TaxID=460621 RepID=UPI0025412AC3|nr:fucolectin-like [Euleptes europaea]